MAQSRIQLKLTEQGVGEPSHVFLQDELVPFGVDGVEDLDVDSGTYDISIVCYGPRGASATVEVNSSTGNLIAPLTATVSNTYGVSHASDEFTVP